MIAVGCFPLAGIIVVDTRADVTTQTFHMAKQMLMCFTDLLCTVKVNSKLGKWSFYCKYLQCVVACFLISMLLLECVGNLIIPALFSFILNYSAGIIPE